MKKLIEGEVISFNPLKIRIDDNTTQVIPNKLVQSKFDKKYEKYRDPIHYGNLIDDPKILIYLDEKFQEVIKKYPEFLFQQIKWKFDQVRIYTNYMGISSIWEDYINQNLL